MVIHITNRTEEKTPSANSDKRTAVLNRHVSQVSARLFGVQGTNREAANQLSNEIQIMNSFEAASYAEHCFDHYGVDVLEHMLLDEPAPSILSRWDLDADQWRQQIRYAIQMIRKD